MFPMPKSKTCKVERNSSSFGQHRGKLFLWGTNMSHRFRADLPLNGDVIADVDIQLEVIPGPEPNPQMSLFPYIYSEE